MLFGKNVVLGVSGGIACYKACEVVSALKKLGAGVDVIMTENACRFVAPLTFQTLAGSAVCVDPFEPVKEFDVKHISLAKKADIMVIAPATANVIAKLATGIADDMLTTTYLASNAIKLICPAMNTAMYEDETTKQNMAILKERGVVFLEPEVGLLACKDVGKGRLAEPQTIVNKIIELIAPRQEFASVRFLITAGGTAEDIDGVRIIANRSSGKMGMALAKAACQRGGSVTMVYGNISAPLDNCIEKAIHVDKTEEMYAACMRELDSVDVVIMAAAPADYKLVDKIEGKLKAEKITLNFEKTVDIAKEIGKVKGDKKLVIFAAETEDLIQNATKKLAEKNADLVVANDVSRTDIGFNSDMNEATLIDKNGSVGSGKLGKLQLAHLILDRVLSL